MNLSLVCVSSEVIQVKIQNYESYFEFFLDITGFITNVGTCN